MQCLLDRRRAYSTVPRLSTAFLFCVGAASALGAVAPLVTPPAPSFSPQVGYTTGRHSAPRSVAIADLNGDGRSDLVTADYASSAVSVLLNRGHGTFEATRNYRTGSFPVAIRIGDLNRDGRVDLATVNSFTNTVTTFLNRGDGGFDSRHEYRSDKQPLSLAIGDLTGDGKPELVTGNAYLADPRSRNPGTISVFVNTGDGGFRPRRDFDVGGFPRSVALHDVNGDGTLDLATANRNAGTASVFINRGDASFEPRRDYRAGSAPRELQIGDVDGDGSPDLVTANTQTHRISVLLNEGSGRFRAVRSHRFGADAPYAIALGDLNGDRKPDLASVNECSDTPASAVTNLGDGSFGAKIDYRTGICPHAVAIGDLNGDGKNDLVTANFVSDNVSVLINTPGRCTVQYVVRMGLVAAKRATIRANCRVGAIRRSYSRFGPRGTVVAQKPRIGSVLPMGGKVSLVVSRGHR